jgi:hypothetical protein
LAWFVSLSSIEALMDSLHEIDPMRARKLLSDILQNIAFGKNLNQWPPVVFVAKVFPRGTHSGKSRSSTWQQLPVSALVPRERLAEVALSAHSWQAKVER